MSITTIQILLMLCLAPLNECFHIAPPPRQGQQSTGTRRRRDNSIQLATAAPAHDVLLRGPARSFLRTSTHLYCICVDCARVTNCAAYHFVETKHQQPHMTDNPTFSPRDGSPTIHVNVRTIREKNTNSINEAEDLDADGRQQHENDFTPNVTTEYDVVACADYVEDKGCWVRNMPEEIKLANPHFVPS